MIAIGFAILVILLVAAIVVIVTRLRGGSQGGCRYNGPVYVDRSRRRNPEKVERQS